MLQCMSKVNLTRFSNELLPVRSPLLRQSQLISFPLLINMLKFSKSSNLTSAWNDREKRNEDQEDDERMILSNVLYIHTHVYTCLDASCFVVNNTDMIKISHVMTTDTNQQMYVLLCIVYNFVFTRMHDIRGNIMYVRYVLQAKSNLERFHWTCQQFISLLDKQMNLMLCKQDWSKFSLDWVLAARCVRVIHAQCVLQFALLSRTLLRSSSNNEPSDPPYRIMFSVYIY